MIKRNIINGLLGLIFIYFTYLFGEHTIHAIINQNESWYSTFIKRPFNTFLIAFFAFACFRIDVYDIISETCKAIKRAKRIKEIKEKRKKNGRK